MTPTTCVKTRSGLEKGEARLQPELKSVPSWCKQKGCYFVCEGGGRESCCGSHLSARAATTLPMSIRSVWGSTAIVEYDAS